METSKKKNGKGETTSTFSPSQICGNKKVFYHFSPQTTKLRKMYFRSIQIFEKFFEKDSFA